MASRFPAAWLDELRQRADIVQVVSGYMQLKRNGRKYWGLCPFHGEKTASFSVDAEQQLYYCFGCKAGGSVIQFVMDIERMDFQEAVRFLADQQRMPLPQMEEDEDYQRRRTQRDRLLAANKEAARYFHQTLFTDAGKPVLDYLKRRGVTDNVIRRFGLGASTSDWDALTRHMRSQGYTDDELRLCGLTVVKEAEPATESAPAKPRRAFDMFRARAIFPIIDQHGNVLAFGGRALGDQQPKYLNTSDTPVFNKRLGVYAANLLRKERHLERVVLVEGYMDVVSLSQFGVKGVCATLGTALTNEQARLLKKFAPKVYLAYDGDSAGQHAILRGLDILKAEGIPARVLDFPDGLDPDEFIRRDGLEGFDNLPAVTPETYRMRRLRDEYNLASQEGRTEYARACANILRDLEPVELEGHLQELMVQTGFTRDVLIAQIGVKAPQAAAAQPETRPRPARRAAPAVSEDARAQEQLIALFATGHVPTDIAADEDFTDPLLQGLYEALKGGASPASLVESQQEEMTRERVSQVLMMQVGEDTNENISMAQDCLNRLRIIRCQDRLNALMRDINTLSGGDKLTAMKEVQQLNAELQRLKAARPGQPMG